MKRGIASIEFLMFIPIIVTFLAVTIWMVKVQTRSMEAGIEAEVLAAEEAVLMTHGESLFQADTLGELHGAHDLMRLVSGFREDLQWTSGLANGISTKETGDGVRGITPAIQSVKQSHSLMAHSWESTVFKFPQTKSEQKELTLPGSVRGIAPVQDLEQFRKLLQF